MPRHAKHLKQRYIEFIQSLGIANYTVAKWSSAFIPLCTGHLQVNKGRIALIGDAAGLADPLTGEGIHSAVLSAKLAAGVIKNSILNYEPDLDGYASLIKTNIVSEMKLAYIYSTILTLVPRRLFAMVQKDERVWRGCCHLLSGERNYTDIKNRLNSLGGIYKFVFGGK